MLASAKGVPGWRRCVTVGLHPIDMVTGLTYGSGCRPRGRRTRVGGRDIAFRPHLMEPSRIRF